MRRFLVLLACGASAAVFAATGTLTEQSQIRARKIVDSAVAAIGGAEALRSIDIVRLDLQGETFPRLQMTTPDPPFEPGQFHETLLLDVRNNRLRLEQRTSGAGFDGHLTVSIADGQGTIYDHRARTATPVPPAQTSQQQFIQYYRRLPHLILRQALDRANSLRYLGEDTFEGRRHHVVTFVMADTQQVALFIDAKTKPGVEVRTGVYRSAARPADVADHLRQLRERRQAEGAAAMELALCRRPRGALPR